MALIFDPDTELPYEKMMLRIPNKEGMYVYFKALYDKKPTWFAYSKRYMNYVHIHEKYVPEKYRSYVLLLGN